MIDCFLFDTFVHAHQLRKRHSPAGGRRNHQRLQGIDIGALSQRHPQKYFHRLSFPIHVHHTGRTSAQRNLYTCGNISGGDAALGRTRAIHDKGYFVLIRFHEPVHIDDPFRFVEYVTHLPCNFYLAGCLRPVNFRDQRAQDRRAGRQLGNLDPGAATVGDTLEFRTHALCDIMALRLAVGLADQVDLYVCDITSFAQEIMADQTVEVVRGGCPDVGLIIRHFRHRFQIFGKRAGHGGRLFQCGSFGHIDDDLKFTFIVKRQHFHGDLLER